MHDIHISTCELNVDSESQSVQATVHIFLDDFELALDTDQSLHFFSDKEIPHADSLIAKYVQDHFHVFADDVECEFTYLGRQLSDDQSAAYLFLEAPLAQLPGRIDVSNDILMQLYDDQRTMIKITWDNQRRHTTLLETQRKTFSFDF